MRRSLVVAGLLLGGCASVPYHALPDHAASVQPLLVAGQKICTTFSINEAAGYWLTANHCWSADQAYSVADVPAQTVRYDEVVDLWLLRSALRAPALRPASTVRHGDAVELVGYPLWWTTPISLFGRVSRVYIEVPEGHGELHGPATLVTVCGELGMSGSPALTSRGVIGVMRGGFRRPCLDTLTPLAAVRAFAGQDWDVPR